MRIKSCRVARGLPRMQWYGMGRKEPLLTAITVAWVGVGFRWVAVVPKHRFCWFAVACLHVPRLGSRDRPRPCFLPGVILRGQKKDACCGALVCNVTPPAAPVTVSDCTSSLGLHPRPQGRAGPLPRPHVPQEHLLPGQGSIDKSRVGP